MRLASRVAEDATCMAYSADAYDLEFDNFLERQYFDVDRQAAEWRRVNMAGNVTCGGIRATDRLWRAIKGGIAGFTHTTDRDLRRIAAFAQLWRYRFMPGGKEPGGPCVVVWETLQRFAAKRVRGRSDVLAARFGDFADFDVYALARAVRERRGISPAQRQNLPTASAQGAAAVRPRRLRREITPEREQRKLRLLRAT